MPGSSQAQTLARHKREKIQRVARARKERLAKDRADRLKRGAREANAASGSRARARIEERRQLRAEGIAQAKQERADKSAARKAESLNRQREADAAKRSMLTKAATVAAKVDDKKVDGKTGTGKPPLVTQTPKAGKVVAKVPSTLVSGAEDAYTDYPALRLEILDFMLYMRDTFNPEFTHAENLAYVAGYAARLDALRDVVAGVVTGVKVFKERQRP